ncbi:enoyl-CoA hydratase/isomerase family protein [Actinomadura madurae]|nr:enoyl-CoA hydratase/isomerase family protein [Actinomadura madurae]
MTIDVRRDGPLWRVRLAAPERRNALSRLMLAELRRVFASADDCGGMVLTGEGGAFSAGADLHDLSGTPDDLAYDDDLSRTVHLIRTAPFPVLAALEGPCVGAAVELALACDLRVAASDAFLQIPAVELGLLYNPRTIARLHRTLPRDTVTRLVLLGERFTAASAQAAGLVSEVAEPGEAAARAEEIATGIVPGPGSASFAATRRLLADLDLGAFDAEHWHRVRLDLLGSDTRRRAVAAAKDRLEHR